MSYYVIVPECDPKTAQPRNRYLVAIQDQPYASSQPRRLLTDDAEEAFDFQERAAAEMAAVFVGGYVEE